METQYSHWIAVFVISFCFKRKSGVQQLNRLLSIILKETYRSVVVSSLSKIPNLILTGVAISHSGFEEITHVSALCRMEKFGKDRVNKKTIKIRVIVRRLFICFHIASYNREKSLRLSC